MHRTDSSFRRHPGGGSLRRFSFRRKLTRESIPEPTSTWSFNDQNHEWQLLRGKLQFSFSFARSNAIYIAIEMIIMIVIDPFHLSLTHVLLSFFIHTH